MTLMQILRADALQARKTAVQGGDDRAKIASSLLVTLVSESSRAGKDNGGRESTDAEVLKVIKRFLDGATDTIGILEKDPATASNEERSLQLVRARVEKDILTEYIDKYQPKMAPEADVVAEVNRVVAGLAEKTPKQIGVVMGALKAKFGATLDGALAQKLVKAALA